MQESHPIRYFAPSWFALVMGTGGLANILWKWQSHWHPTRWFALVLAAIALFAYGIILIVWSLRWIRYPKYALRDLHHPVTSNFYVTTGIATVIIATNLYNIWSGWLPQRGLYWTCMVLWILSCLIVVFCTFYTTYRMFSAKEAFAPQMVNFAWLMAPIANMAVLLIGCPVFSMSLTQQPSLSLLLFTINAAFFGIGFFLFLFISAIVFVRLVQAELPSPATTPTFGIFLSAVGLAAGTFFDLGSNAVSLGLLSSVELVNLLCMVTWGFGIWIIGIIFLICLHHVRHGGMPFTLSWWAFTFPLAAYTIASLKIFGAYPCGFTGGYTVFLTVLLSVLWVYIFVQTLRGIRNGSLFLGTPISDEEPL